MNHILTEQDLEVNPCLAEQGCEVGDEVELIDYCDKDGNPLIVSGNVDKPLFVLQVVRVKLANSEAVGTIRGVLSTSEGTVYNIGLWMGETEAIISNIKPEFISAV